MGRSVRHARRTNGDAHQREIESWLNNSRVAGRHDEPSAEAKRTLHLDEDDQRYTDEVAIVGPFGEDDQQIFKELLERTGDAPIVDNLRRFSPGQTRLIRGLKAGQRWRTVRRESDRRTFSCAASLYPLLHERCLGLLQNWTGMTPQELWAVVRQCNKDYIPTGIRQGISGVDYYELRLDVEWLYVTILDSPRLRDEWMQSLLFKTTLDDGDLYKFLMDSLLLDQSSPKQIPYLTSCSSAQSA